MPKLFLVAILFASSVFADPHIVNFKGRQINLDNHFTSYPFQAPFVDAQAGKLVYRDRGDGNKLKMLSYDPRRVRRGDQRRGVLLSADDFSTRTVWWMSYSLAKNKVYLRVDKNHDESYNIYEIDPVTLAERNVSNVGYVFSETMSDDGRQIAIITRSGKDESSEGDVRVLDLMTGSQEIVFKDSKAMKMTWGLIKFQPGNKGLIISYIADSDRNRENLAYISLEQPNNYRVLTDTSKTRATNGLKWLNDREFLYMSNEEDFTGVYKASLDNNRVELITQRGSNVKGFTVLKTRNSQLLLTILGTVLSSDVKVTNLTSGKVLFAQKFEEQISINGTHGNQAILYGTSLNQSFHNTAVTAEDDSVRFDELLAYPRDVAAKIVNCVPEKISYKTFDGASAPGENGTLHAYLLKPKKPLSEPLALVETFYGGSNAFSVDYHIFCEAGIYVLTPAPRGSTEFGQEFENLAKGDIGGGDTLDVVEAGKYLQNRLGIPSNRIGVFGGSRGGYQALRALTLPEEINGVRVDFKFGFGISDYGISNLIRAYELGNIQGWYEQLTGGDPRKESEKWLERSPERNADRLSGPLLLTHGTLDKRVPTVESEAMYERAKALGKEVYFVKFEGQGHGYRGNEAMFKYFGATLEFLDRIK